MVHWLNQDGRVNAFYSTPAEYAAAKLAPEAGVQKTYSLNEYDLFPYADSPHSVWSGYFVSRSALKGYIRKVRGAVRHRVLGGAGGLFS